MSSLFEYPAFIGDTVAESQAKGFHNDALHHFEFAWPSGLLDLHMYIIFLKIFFNQEIKSFKVGLTDISLVLYGQISLKLLYSYY